MYYQKNRLSRDKLVMQVIDTSEVTLCMLFSSNLEVYAVKRRGGKGRSVEMNQSHLVECTPEFQNTRGLDDMMVSTGSCEKAI
jgi:hypothetical protein